jgi:hypothetical protein
VSRAGAAWTPAALLVALAAQGSDPALPSAWRHWPYSAAIALPALGSPRLVRVLVPDHVSRRAQAGWSDLRVIDDSGREVPYVLHARLGRRSREDRAARLMDLTHKPGEDTRATLDLGPGSPVHNRIEIRTAAPEFFARVAIDVSAGGKDWRVLREDAPIYRFEASGLRGNQAVGYTDNSSRYVRLRITDGTGRFPLDAVVVRYEVAEEAELVPVELPVRPDPAALAGETWWLAEGGGQPVAALEIAAEQETFHRPVRIRASDDGATWRVVTSGAVYRMGRGRERDQLRVELGETRARLLRVEVVNRSDPPLAGARLGFYATPRRVVFRAAPGRGYRLAYGNPRAAAPDYELARVTVAGDLAAAAPAELGPEAANAGYVDPAPWTERHPAVLWAALIVAVAVVGALAIRALRSAAPAGAA